MTSVAGRDVVLGVEGIAKRYGATVALSDVHLRLRRGEVHAVIGENGAGKSTLMNVLAGAVRPDGGRMLLDGGAYLPDTPLAARTAGIALIHQELSLCAHLSVEENILLGTEIAHRGWIDRPRTRERARELLSQFPHPALTPDRLVRHLPPAARQIVEICRALAADARIILMDEPTSSLQRGEVSRLFALIRGLATRGIAVVYISHFLEEVREIADAYTVLRDGRTVATGDIADITNEQLVAAMVGRSGNALFPSRISGRSHDVALSVRALSSRPRLLEATFDLHRGEILGIAGLLGSGRTELVRALFGLDTPDAGQIVVEGRITSLAAGPGDRLRTGFGFLSEDRQGEGLALPLPIVDNVCATRPALVVPQLGLIDTAQEGAAAERWMRHLHIRARTATQPVRSLSGGNQQKVAIARLLNQDAEVLLLDEPTRGVDVGSRAEIYDVIAERASAGCAVLVVSSYLPELFGLCDRIAVMCRGRLSPVYDVGELSPERVLALATGS